MCEENLSLVNAVKRYPCLYNYNIPEYMKKEETDVAWNEVAIHIGQSVHECKEKWRNLRYSYLRSLKRHPDGTARKKYYLHREMEFVLPFMKTRFDGIIPPQFEDESEDDTKTISNNGDEALEEPSHLEYCTLDFQTTESEPRPKKRKIPRSLRANAKVECPRKMFLLSLLPEIASLSESQMKAFRRNVFKLIDHVSHNTGTNKNNSLEAGEGNSEEREFLTIVKAEPL